MRCSPPTHTFPPFPFFSETNGKRLRQGASLYRRRCLFPLLLPFFSREVANSLQDARVDGWKVVQEHPWGQLDLGEGRGVPDLRDRARLGIQVPKMYDSSRWNHKGRGRVIPKFKLIIAVLLQRRAACISPNDLPHFLHCVDGSVQRSSSHELIDEVLHVVDGKSRDDVLPTDRRSNKGFRFHGKIQAH